jgi:hypothetical protein
MDMNYFIQYIFQEVGEQKMGDIIVTEFVIYTSFGINITVNVGTDGANENFPFRSLFQFRHRFARISVSFAPITSYMDQSSGIISAQLVTEAKSQKYTLLDNCPEWSLFDFRRSSDAWSATILAHST